MESLTFVVFGGTGDLTKRKLVPAFASLVKDKLIKKNSSIIGIGRSNFNHKTYKQLLLEGKDDATRDLINTLDVRYYQGDVTNPESMKGLSELINKCETEKCKRIFYLATSFKLFPKITEIIKKQGLNKFAKIVLEKPFGEDLKSNNKFETAVTKVFTEKQVFRIDHYLGKETVMNLHTLRFENPIFDSFLNKENIESINITVDENLKVGSRIFFYNEFGAIKDMIQSHLLQVLSLLLMQNPQNFTADNIHKEKVKILKKIEVKPAKNHLLGQYKSYKNELKEKGLKDIKTETFVRLALNCNTPRWDGIDITLQTGKALPSKYGKIEIESKADGCMPNKLVVHIQPLQDIDLQLNIQKDHMCEPVNMNFCHACRFGPNAKDGYEKMLADVINGDHTLFTSAAENKAAWKIIEKIESMKSRIPFKIYKDLTLP